MKLNRIELKKILYDFNSISSRLLQADFDDFNNILRKFLNFIQNNEVIHDYILSCGECDQNIDSEFKVVRESFGHSIFTLGDTDEEETRNIHAILSYIVTNNEQIHFGVARGYSASDKFQDEVSGFNNRVVMVLVNNIERYLTKIGMDMGIDDKISYVITVEKGQVNIASDSATINSNSVFNGIDTDKLPALIEAIKSNSGQLSREDSEILERNLDVIEAEAKNAKPRSTLLQTAIKGLEAIKGTVEFCAAVATLVQFVQPLLH